MEKIIGENNAERIYEKTNKILIGAALYFLISSDARDTSFSYVSSVLGTEGLSQLASKGISLQCIQS